MTRPGFPYFEDFTATAHDPSRAEAVLADLREAAADDKDLQIPWDDDNVIRLLTAIFGNSPFLGQVAQADRRFLPELFMQEPADNLDQILFSLKQNLELAPHIDGAMVVLRQARRRAALLIAVADVSGSWDLTIVTAALSRFAEIAISGDLRWLLRDAARREDLDLPDPRHPETGSGLVILGMGKLGANELNYSSDVDLIVLYDEEGVPYIGNKSAQDCFIRLIRDLVKMLQQPTGDGYVLRTDLRLRPDPGVTPIVVSMSAAEQYYESLGQNWERAAMIKARPVAGDLVAGAGFLKRMQPFIWRRNLDYAAIADIRSIVRRIHRHEGGNPVCAFPPLLAP